MSWILPFVQFQKKRIIPTIPYIGRKYLRRRERRIPGDMRSYSKRVSSDVELPDCILTVQVYQEATFGSKNKVLRLLKDFRHGLDSVDSASAGTFAFGRSVAFFVSCGLADWTPQSPGSLRDLACYAFFNHGMSFRTDAPALSRGVLVS